MNFNVLMLLSTNVWWFFSSTLERSYATYWVAAYLEAYEDPTKQVVNIFWTNNKDTINTKIPLWICNLPWFWEGFAWEERSSFSKQRTADCYWKANETPAVNNPLPAMSQENQHEYFKDMPALPDTTWLAVYGGGAGKPGAMTLAIGTKPALL